MLNKLFKVSVFVVAMTLPFISYAQQFLGKTSGLLGEVKNIVNDKLIPIVFSLALLLFFWGVTKYIWSEGGAKEDGRKIMLWGVVALFVMASIWGLVAFIQGALLGSSVPNNMHTPTIGGSGGGGGNNGCVDGYNAQGNQDGC